MGLPSAQYQSMSSGAMGAAAVESHRQESMPSNRRMFLRATASATQNAAASAAGTRLFAFRNVARRLPKRMAAR